MGYCHTFLSVFGLTSEIDFGPLYRQISININVNINVNETIVTLLSKVNVASYQGGFWAAQELMSKGYLRTIQKDANLESVFFQRSLEDIEIDCRMSGEVI